MASSSKEGFLKKAPLTVATNPYKARKVWPPNFKQLTVQQQLRFEKKYKRRIILASRAPRWVKFVKTAQLLTIVGKIILTQSFLDLSNSSSSCTDLDLLLLRVRMVGSEVQAF